MNPGAIPPAAAAAAMREAQAENISLQIKLLRPEAMAPTRGSKFSAGYDVYVCEDAVVPKYGKAMLRTGIAVAIPPGTCAYRHLTAAEVAVDGGDALLIAKQMHG